MTLANVVSLVLLVHHVFYAAHVIQGRKLLLLGGRGVAHQRDRLRSLVLGGRPRRASSGRSGAKLDCPICSSPRWRIPRFAPSDWRPRFVDYLYTSLANGTSFAPADAMPLTFR